MIEDIAAALPDPGRLIGLHFFNPVALMPLVEVVRGAQSREDEVKRGAAFVAAIDKFPLITKSVPGFLVNRVLTPYMFGAMQRLEQGEDKERIDEAARTFGMPMGPIELADAVGLDVCAHVAKILKFHSDGFASSIASSRPASSARRRARASTCGRTARPRSRAAPSTRRDMERLGRELVEPMIDEAQRCLDERVVESADLVDGGVIFGTGFAPFRGGPLHYKAAQGGSEPARAAAE